MKPAAVAILMGLCFGSLSFAADWAQPPVPLPSPLKTHVQRFVDSTQTRNYQGSPVRTYRALERTKYNPANDAFYMIMGNGYRKYNATDLFSGGRPLARVTRPDDGSGGGELHLLGAASYDKDDKNSGWDGHADGQFFLKDFDFDDRGNHYLAYSSFSWGILKESGSKLSLLWYHNGATSSAQTCPAGSCPSYTMVLSLRDGSNYYALVGGPGSWGLWDVNNPSAPVYKRTLNLGAYISRNDTGTLFALGSNQASVRLLTGSQIVAGNEQGTTVPLSGKVLASTFNNGAFWFLQSSGNTFFKVSPLGTVTSFPVTGSTLAFTWAAAGSDYVVGGTSNDMRVYKVNASGVVEETALNSFKDAYYLRSADISQKHVLPFTHGGKTYFIWSAYSLGDVYEVKAGDSLSVTRDSSASLGTKNTRTPLPSRDLGPYFGDLTTFRATFSGGTAPSQIKWSFDYPSAPWGSSQGLNDAATHRYAGPSTLARKIRAEATTNPAVFGETSLTLLVPKARILVPGTDELVETGSKSIGKILVGGSFYDASDGVVEGHVSRWTLNGSTAADQLPTAPFSVGACGGPHTLAFSARYDGHTPAISGLTYSVQPFVVAAATGTTTATQITFNNTSTVGTGFATGAEWTETWELVDTNGLTVGAPQVVTTTLGTKSTFTVLKSLIVSPGFKVRLTIDIAAAALPAGCTSFVTDSVEIPLEKPDPLIVTTSCQDPTTASGSCTLSVNSASGRSKTGWTYQWYLDGNLASTSATYAPNFTSAKNYTIRVVATNPFGEGEDTETLTVTVPPCDGAPPDGLISFNAVKLSGRTYQFGPTAHGYDYQDCDTFNWNFGDGTSPSTAKEPQHTFAADGSYSVTLTVTNSNGSASVTFTVTVGTVAPPPPPPGPVTCADPRGQVFVNFNGPQSGCAPGVFSAPCNVGEGVQFTIDPKPPFALASCHTQTWQFGSGASPVSSTARSATASYSTVGTRTVILTVSNGSVSAQTSVNVTTQAVTCGTTVPSDLRINYAGLTSGCFPGSSVPCKQGEQFRFSIAKDGDYTLSGCETIAWNLGDGTTSSSPNAFNHTFPGAGPYTVTLGVTNSQGTFPTSTTVRFFDPTVEKPVVTVTPVSTKAKVGSEIFFLGNVQTDPDYPVVALNWRVIRTTGGDAVIRTESNQGAITHTFNDVGDYRVEFTATNAGGVSTPAVALINVALIQEYSYLIPVVAHLPGSNGTQWRTDLQIFNTDPLKAPIEFEFEFRGGQAGVTKTITMTSSTAIYEDFLAELSKPFGSLEDAGPVVVKARGDSPPQMWSRTYTVDASGIGSYGQFIPAVPLDSSLESEGQIVTYVLPGLEISGRFRTNLGIVNPSTQPVSVNVMARDGSPFGFLIGSFDVQVPPLALVQIGDLHTRIAGIVLGEPFSLNLQTLGDAPLVVYGSMIDQLSNDPVYISGIRDIDQEGEGRRVQILPGAGHLEQSNGTWRSDVVIYNPDILPVHVDLTYFDGSGTKVAEARNQPLGSGAFVRIEDVLKWPSLDTDPGNSFGLIKVETQQSVNRYPIVFERTYKDRGEIGSFGQGIPAISPEDANVKVGQPAFLAGVRSDESFYTNLGLVAVGDSPSVVKVTLLHDGSGTPVGTWQYVIGGEVAGINPNASLIVTNIIRAISPLANRGTLKIEVMSGGDLWAYASVIAASDPTCAGCAKPEHTFDPEYIPAVKMPMP